MNKWASERLARWAQVWGRVSSAQRWLIGGMVLALLLATSLGVYLNRPDWVVLVSQADPKDAADIAARLQELQVPYRPTGDGYTITVPKSDLYTARLALAQAGIPRGGSVGMELFDEPKFGTTDFERRVNYLRAQQGELERALARIAELEYANVKLAIPEQSVFVRERQPVTAAVLVQVRPGRKLSPDQVAGIVDFVANSVQGLTSENVKVVDQTGRLLSGMGAEGSGQVDSDQYQRQMSLQRDVEQRVQALLEPIFGAKNVIARVNLELTTESSRIENQTVGGSTPKSTEVIRETSQGAVPNAPLTGGAGNQNPPVYQGQQGATAAGDQWSTRTITNYEVSQRKEVTLIAPGSIKRISVGIAVNRPDLTPEQIRQIQETVSGATGATVSEISVAAMSFATEPAEAPTGGAEAGLQTTPLLVGGGLAAALLLVGVLVNRRRRGTALRTVEEERTAAHVGRRLDVALGLESPSEGTVDGPGPTLAAASSAPTEEPDPREKLTMIMRQKPKRQQTFEGKAVDPELIEQAEELIHTSPDASAAVLRQWLRGGA